MPLWAGTQCFIQDGWGEREIQKMLYFLFKYLDDTLQELIFILRRWRGVCVCVRWQGEEEGEKDLQSTLVEEPQGSCRWRGRCT